MTGVLSAIYDAWTYDRSDQEAGIVFWGSVQQEMFCEYREVREDEKKAEAVRRLIHRHLGEEAELSVGYALLSEDPGKGTAILRMMMEARNLPDGKKIMGHLSHPEVRRVFELSRNVGRKHMRGKSFFVFRSWKEGFFMPALHRIILSFRGLLIIFPTGSRWKIL